MLPRGASHMQPGMAPSSVQMQRFRRFSWHWAWMPWLAACVALDADPVQNEGGALATDAMTVAEDAANDAGDAWLPTDANTSVVGRGDAAGQSVPDGSPGTVTDGAPPAQRMDGSATPAPGGGSTSGGGAVGGSIGGIGGGTMGGTTTPTCTANLSCTPTETCKVGKTACTGTTSSCLASGDAADGTPCSGTGVCSKGHCCAPGQDWNGSACAIVCGSNERLCGTSCIGADQPCNGGCPVGRILCSSQCVVGNCCDNDDCGRCMKCSNHQCINQTASEDLKNNCYEGPCDTGNCDGAGDCGHLPKGTVYCEVTRLITCSGGESFTDMQCAENCLPSCKPTDSSCRGPATCNECQPGLGFTHCASSTSVAQCGSNGRWLPGVACGSGKVCRGNEYTASCTTP